MFDAHVYVNRRRSLVEAMARTASEGTRGIAIFLGNADAPQNYRGNDYKFRQDSSFLYFWGIGEPCLAAVIDFDSGYECLYGDDVDIDDIIWMGPQPGIAEKGRLAGCASAAPLADFAAFVSKAVSCGRPVHFLPPARHYNVMRIAELTGVPAVSVRKVAPMCQDGGRHASEELVKAVVSLRIIKEECEIAEIDKACDIGYLMHTEARNGCRPGVLEQEIVGRMEGVTLSKGWGVSFATILSQNGETLHNHSHHQIITDGRLLVVDAGAESNTHYASDFTRTYPCGGKFTDRQREIYDIVESANELAFSLTRPGVTYYDVHLATVRHMLCSLKDLGLVRGDVDEMVAEGISGLFMPHGLGHNMGLDVHDMEDFGEDYVGYDPGQKRSPLLGLGNLRMARMLRPGHVVTDEPGIYFIPALIEKWKQEGTGRDFVNYAALESYYGFGGIRLEDDVLVTENGARRLGAARLPIKSSEIEELMMSWK
ncbi:MAG: aminopeptidase P family protein [Bacteroidales bacterium]|nr:aminopeptidase P family protein [Bacteroidales bacterium]